MSLLFGRMLRFMVDGLKQNASIMSEDNNRKYMDWCSPRSSLFTQAFMSYLLYLKIHSLMPQINLL